MNLDELAREAFRIMAEANIPAEIIGGYALQHYGYERQTTDIDLVVKDHQEAMEAFRKAGYVEGRLWFSMKPSEDCKYAIDVLPSGRRMSGNDMPNPIPSKVSSIPAFAPLRDVLISKLGVITSNGSETKDKYKNLADVMYLLDINPMARDIMNDVPEVVAYEYMKIWDEVERSKKKKASLDSFSDFFWH